MILWMLSFIIAQSEAPAASASATSNAVEAPSSEAIVYSYNPFGKRDPFKSYITDRKGEAQKSTDPLLNWDLNRFSLSGVLWGISNPKAIVKDGGGRGHIISRGTRIGRNRGTVVRILKDEVVVSEEFRDPLGKLLVSEYSLKLEKKDKGALK